MIVLSFVLVIVAAVTLVIGLFQTDTGLEWIWASIGSCLAAMVFLGIGVLQRRGARPQTAADETYEPPSSATERAGLSTAPGGVAGVPPESEDARISSAPRDTGVPRTPGGTGVLPAMEEPARGATPPDHVSGASEGVTVFSGPTRRDTSEDLVETEQVDFFPEEREVESAPSFFADEPAVVPKRTAKTPLSTGLNRTGAEAAADARSEGPTAPGRTAAASVGDATSTVAPGQTAPSARSRPGTKKTAARAEERTGAKKTAAKATKKATSRKAATAPSAGRETARRRTAKEATEAAGVVRGQTGGRSDVAKSAKRTARPTKEDAARAELAKIRGLGPAKQEALLREFGSLEAIRAATIEQLTSIRGIGETTAREILAQPRR